MVSTHRGFVQIGIDATVRYLLSPPSRRECTGSVRKKSYDARERIFGAELLDIRANAFPQVMRQRL